MCRRSVAKIAFDTTEAMLRLFEHPADDPAVVVTEGKNVIQRREATLLAFLLHLFELLRVELVVLDGSPVIAGGVHRETRSESAIHTNDQRVVAGTAVPVLQVAVDEVLHLGQALDRVHHVVTGLLLLNQPIDKLCYRRMVFFTDERWIRIQMLEMRL